MTGAKRRAEIVQRIQAQAEPVSGQKLAEAYGVSRQVIVQDIALIRAAGYDIIAEDGIVRCALFPTDTGIL